MVVFSFFPASFLFYIFCTRLTPRKATGCPVVDVVVRYWSRFYSCRLQQCCSRCCAGGHRISSSSHGSRREGKCRAREGQCLVFWCPGSSDVPEVSLLVHTSLCHFVVTLLSRQVFCFSRFFSLLLTLETACHADKLGETRSQPVSFRVCVRVFLSLSSDSGQSDRIRYSFLGGISIYFRVTTRWTFPGCALICQNVSVASIGRNNVDESPINVLSRRVCGFYVYIVPAATD